MARKQEQDNHHHHHKKKKKEGREGGRREREAAGSLLLSDKQRLCERTMYGRVCSLSGQIFFRDPVVLELICYRTTANGLKNLVRCFFHACMLGAE